MLVYTEWICLPTLRTCWIANQPWLKLWSLIGLEISAIHSNAMFAIRTSIICSNPSKPPCLHTMQIVLDPFDIRSHYCWSNKRDSTLSSFPCRLRIVFINERTKICYSTIFVYVWPLMLERNPFEKRNRWALIQGWSLFQY